MLYWPVWDNDFINADDTGYITQNPHVNTGLTVANVKWALTTTEQANWHPLTWISHMADCELFGLMPGAHHMVSVFFHIANSLLLLLFLKEATGAFWRSVMVAALFAWHPMHVESVAWAAERKDVLSTFFWLLSLLAYVEYSRGKSVACHLFSLLFFAAGLLSKPMVVTLPFVLLLLDWWPLNRINEKTIGRLLLEKLPFFLLTLGGCVVTFLAQKGGGAVAPTPWLARAESVAVSYIQYISKLVAPIHLASPYSHPPHPILWWSGLAALLLVLVSGWALIAAKSNPYFVFGWLYFLGTLVPVIGIIQVGTQSMADRYTYIPGIGLFVLMVWAVADLLKNQPNRSFIGTVAGAACLGVACLLTSAQIEYWRNSQVLFQHALAVTRNNYLAEDWLGETLRDTGQTEPALDLFEQSVAEEPHYAPAQADLAQELLATGRPAESLAHLQMAAALSPNDAAIQQNWGAVLATHGETKEGIVHLETALKLEPHSVRTLNQLAWIYATSANVQNRNGARSVQLAEEVCAATRNGNALYLQTLGAAYAEAGDFSRAAHWLEQARMLATAHQQTNILNRLPVIEKAVSGQQPYRDPGLR